MKYTLLIIIAILLSCSNKTSNKSVTQTDSLTYKIEAKNIEIDLLKEELANTKEFIRKLEDNHLKPKTVKQGDCECNIDYVRIAKQSISNLTEDMLLDFFCTFSNRCKNNTEFVQLRNATLHDVISKKAELFISTIHRNRNKIVLSAILNVVENPVHNGFNLLENYQSIKEIYGYESTKDAVLASLEVSMNKRNINYSNDDDCIFDSATQTDEFLQGIPELENYAWNKHINSAKIQLQANETLFITRGGCNHFGISADFYITGKEINLEQALKKVIWIAELLNNEFETELLKEAIEKKEYTTDDLSYISFSNQRLSDLTYSMSFKQSNEETKISLSWYMN